MPLTDDNKKKVKNIEMKYSYLVRFQTKNLTGYQIYTDILLHNHDRPAVRFW